MVNSTADTQSMITIQVKPSFNLLMKIDAKRLAKICAETVRSIDDRNSMRLGTEIRPIHRPQIDYLRERADSQILYREMVANEIKSFARKRGMAPSLDSNTIDSKTGPHISLRCTRAFANTLDQHSWHIFGVGKVIVPLQPSP